MNRRNKSSIKELLSEMEAQMNESIRRYKNLTSSTNSKFLKVIKDNPLHEELEIVLLDSFVTYREKVGKEIDFDNFFEKRVKKILEEIGEEEVEQIRKKAKATLSNIPNL